MAYETTQVWGAVAAADPAFFLNGNNGYVFNRHNATLHADHISSPGNFSGELYLQLWALDAQFDGVQLRGQRIATLELGQLFSGNAFTDVMGEVPVQVPADGEYHIVLALVEQQNGIDYIHDWRGYACTEVFSAAPQIDSPVTPAAPVGTVTAEDVAEAVAALEAPSAKTKPKRAKVAKPAKDSRLNVNTAKESAIASLNGVTKPVAKHIINNRPYKRLEDLLEVKGIGKKVLEKLKSQIKF